MHIIYLDQFATSGMFDSTGIPEWEEIRSLLHTGVTMNKIICPMSVEHYLETSQKDSARAAHLDTEFYKLSMGYAFKAEPFITSQLMISAVRKNNITIRTFLHDKIKKGILEDEGNYQALHRQKIEFNMKAAEATVVAHHIRKIARHKKVDSKVGQSILAASRFITLSHFLERLNALLVHGHIIIRPVSFPSGDIPNWIDSIIYQLTNRHRMTKKELKTLISHLRKFEFTRIPTLDIRTSLSGLIAVNNKNENPNDQIDIGRIATGLALSDILLTDSQRKSEIQELGLDSKYRTKVFSGKKKDLEQLIGELKSIVAM
ncbi:hypothetical protein [Pontibacter arcticus]|uniref:PIN domain-containing protein n=1 Tax=Pontibacter arcticus TaxID=2080288 RepID=A0A364RAA7_9BACT|nr:hypothetical protein [Pontibacter arcticus]RAU81330.1 hypothetical protein DP923_15970 [Pontibacter arcticus]RAU81395.1 hypothetical protein DP923_16315 [Pontibacter arcticus]